MKAEEFDERFDRGEDLTAALDLSSARRQLSVQLPAWMVDGLDREASRLGVTRQVLLETRIAKRLAKSPA